MSGKVVTLVVPPGTGGVRDYADILASGLRAHGHDATVFTWQKDKVEEIDVHIASSDCIYLQYSGYGFAKRGAPLWMVSHLRERRSEIRRLGVFFHELFASGPPWGSAFWLSPVQRYVAAELAKLSDFWLTNRELSSQWLASHAADSPNAVLAVFSNVGEHAAYLSARKRKVVVFGSAPRRRKTYAEAGTRLFQWIKRHGLELHDIGSPLCDATLDARLEEHGAQRHGRIETTQVNELLSDAMFGLLACPVEFVAKSGVFAAYCAHGVTPVLLSEGRALCDRLKVGEQYLPTDIFESNELFAERNHGYEAWRWYMEHDTRQHLLRTSDLLR